MKVEIARVHPDAVLPDYQTAGAACFDLTCAEEATISPGAIAHLHTGLIVRVPEGYMLMVAPRSSMPKRTGLVMPHSIGIIDQDYCGPKDELMIQVQNPTRAPVTVRKGDRICQAGFVRVDRAEWIEGPPTAETSRGGFGSTGA